jgi:hypothetical protein
LNHKLVTAIAIALLSTNVQAEMTLAEKKVHVMAIDPGDYATQALKPIIIPIPPDKGTGVGDHGTERDIVGGVVRLSLIYTGKWSKYPWIQPPWFEFKDARTQKRYRFMVGDTVTAVFKDLSTVQFEFIGTAYECPSGQCFVWKDGTETPAVIKPRRNPDRVGRDHPGKGRRDHYVHTGSDYLAPMGPPYDPYDPDNWSGPAPGHDSRVNTAPAPVTKTPPVVTVTPPVRSGGGGRR